MYNEIIDTPTDHLIDDLPPQDKYMDQLRQRLGFIAWRVNVTEDGMTMIFEQSHYNEFAPWVEKAIRNAAADLPLEVERDTYRPAGTNLVLWDIIRVHYTGKN